MNWPIDTEYSRLERQLSDRLGIRTVRLLLYYAPNGSAGLTDFGANVRLVDNATVSNGPVTVFLDDNGRGRLVPESTSLVVDWEGLVGTRHASVGTGYPEASGVPMAGSVTLVEVTDDFAAGHYVYHFADGSELTCTFNIPTPERADGWWDGDVEYDDDDDDD
ncbi:putative lipoprotein [Myxococcus hansupus]|uniref:Putative lipoprotein n=1 Tax=Pseudomyxococcus hansupus TaxID=1297742 RepID=A0A0H4WMB0_9BACT|nr:putative lipoprotein [Myxococcus hansupus]